MAMPRDAKDASLNDGVRCDAIGCTAKLADGRLVAFALSAEAFEEDCARAAVVVSPRENPLRRRPGGCKAVLIDRPAWRAHGATALYRTAEGLRAARWRIRQAWTGPGRGLCRETADTARIDCAARQRRTRRRKSEDLEAGD